MLGDGFRISGLAVVCLCFVPVSECLHMSFGGFEGVGWGGVGAGVGNP